MNEVLRTSSEDETSAAAARLASGLPSGAIVLLTGDLGAGKTAFVRGMAAGLGIDPDDISSPTFTLIQEYRPPVGEVAPAPEDGRRGGRAPAREGSRLPCVLSHVDLYRLEGAEVDDLGLEELSGGGGVVAIEWAEKLGSPPRVAFRVTISDLGGDEREIRIEHPRA
jgi:tRNA threonylcarbamoyladenosine biosynthesis protein TsaE